MSRDIVRRYRIADYLNVGTSDSPEYVLMGTGFTSLNEQPGAQTESVQYVNEVSATSSVESYQTAFPFEAEHVIDEKAVDALYTVARNHYVGSDAEFEYVRVELWNSVKDGGTSYEARKFIVAAEVSDYQGTAKQTLSGNLNAVGDPVLGTFDTSTLAFTEAAA